MLRVPWLPLLSSVGAVHHSVPIWLRAFQGTEAQSHASSGQGTKETAIYRTVLRDPLQSIRAMRPWADTASFSATLSAMTPYPTTLSRLFVPCRFPVGMRFREFWSRKMRMQRHLSPDTWSATVHRTPFQRRVSATIRQ